MKIKKIAATIEVRMTSSRLPGKVLMEALPNISMLEYMIKRVRKSKLVDEIIVATTINETDDPIVELCKDLKINYYRGSENDVLLRVLNAHKHFNSDIIVELTGDCPLIDPVLIDKVIEAYLNNNYDYVSNAHVRSYPDGFDVQVFSVDLLDEVSKLANTSYDRENVTSYIYKTDKYNIYAVVAESKLFWPELRVTLDDKGDYLLIKNIIKEMSDKKNHNYSALDVVVYLKNNINLLELNKDARVVDAPYQKTANK